MGESNLPWDITKTYWYFTHSDKALNIDLNVKTFWDMHSGELKWVQIQENDMIIEVKSLEPASFTDHDFELTGCNPFDDNLTASEKKLPSNNSPIK